MSRPRKNPKVPRREDLLQELERLHARMEELARELFLSRPHARDVTRSLPSCEVSLSLGFNGRGEGRRGQTEELLKKLESHIDDAIATHAAFRPGVVYSFFSEEANPAEGCPQSPRDVFAGYSETGVPRFLSMLEYGVEKKHAAVDQLTSESGTIVTIKSGRDELLSKRLPDFERRNRNYDIRGQIVLGYFTQKVAEREERFAVTIQIVRSSTRSRVVRLGLNAIGLLPDGRPVLRLIIEEPEHPLAELIRHADRSLARINQELKKLPSGKRLPHAAMCADELLAEMALGQGRHSRRESWRTRHASERARTRTRPTGCARSDLGRARPQQVLLDKQEKTFIILGPKGRIHVFNEGGRHVTSLQLEKRAIDQRQARKRWIALDAEDGQAVLDLARKAFKEAGRGARAD